jgi:hypothetical protein
MSLYFNADGSTQIINSTCSAPPNNIKKLNIDNKKKINNIIINKPKSFNKKKLTLK